MFYCGAPIPTHVELLSILYVWQYLVILIYVWQYLTGLVWTKVTNQFKMWMYSLLDSSSEEEDLRGQKLPPIDLKPKPVTRKGNTAKGTKRLQLFSWFCGIGSEKQQFISTFFSCRWWICFFFFFSFKLLISCTAECHLYDDWSYFSSFIKSHSPKLQQYVFLHPKLFPFVFRKKVLNISCNLFLCPPS